MNYLMNYLMKALALMSFGFLATIANSSTDIIMLYLLVLVLGLLDSQLDLLGRHQISY